MEKELTLKEATISVVIVLYRDGRTTSKLFSTKAQALKYQMDLDWRECNNSIGIWKILIEEISI